VFLNRWPKGVLGEEIFLPKMRSWKATLPLKQGGDSFRGSSRESCAMYESTTQRCCKRRPSNIRASRRGYT